MPLGAGDMEGLPEVWRFMISKALKKDSWKAVVMEYLAWSATEKEL